jgi:hypothetical protein
MIKKNTKKVTIPARVVEITESLHVRNKNAAQMHIQFPKGEKYVYLSQQDNERGFGGSYLFNADGLRELAEAFRMAADMLDKQNKD